MADWAYLRSSAGEPRTGDDVDGARILLRAKYYVPDLLPALFAPADILAAPRDRHWFATRADLAVARLRALWSQAAHDARFAALWEGSEPVAAWVADLGSEAWLTLDVRGIVGMWDPQEKLVEALGRSATDLAALASQWSVATANGLLGPWLGGNDPATDSVAVRRWTRTERPRDAFFNLAFGWPDDDAERTARWQPWFDAGPAGSPMPDVAEEATRLRRELERRRLAAFSERPAHQRWIAQFLGTALRERTAQGLAEVLNVMVARGLIEQLHDAPAELERVLRDLDRPESAD